MSTFRSVPKLASFIFVLLAVCALGGAGAAEGPRDRGDRAGRVQGDQSLNGFTATLTVTEAADMCLELEDPSVTHTEVVTVTQEGDTQVATSQSFFSGAPVYRKPGEGTLPLVDYDSAGNFLLWRRVETYRRSTPAGHETLKISVLHRISPKGLVTTENPYQQLERRSTGPGEAASDIDLILLALGQGFSRYLGEAPVLEKGSDGQLHGRVTGKFGRSQEGTWELDYAQEGGIVRKASFYGVGQLLPALTVVNEGAVTAGSMTLARSGEITMGRSGQQHRLVVSLKSLSPVADTKLLGEVNERIERPLPRGAEVIDLRDGRFERVIVNPDPDPDPGGGTPVNCCQCGSVSKVFNECGHLASSTVCASDWCIKNVINTASCFQKAASGVTDCRIQQGIGPWAVQHLILLPNGGCPTGGNAVRYATKVTVYKSCSACTPGSAMPIQTACDITSCPAGEEACTSNRGTRMACY